MYAFHPPPVCWLEAFSYQPPSGYPHIYNLYPIAIVLFRTVLLRATGALCYARVLYCTNSPEIAGAKANIVLKAPGLHFYQVIEPGWACSSKGPYCI